MRQLVREVGPGWGARAALALLIGASALLSSGCVLRAFFYSAFIDRTSEYPDSDQYDDARKAAAAADATVAVCHQAKNYTACTYFIAGEEVYSNFRIRGIPDFWWALIDPIIVQVPADTTSISGTFSGGTTHYPLVITTTRSFPVQPGIEVTAEPGKTFLIIELPQSAAESISATDPAQGPQFHFDLNYESLSADAFTVKAMFTVKVSTDDQDYYLPMLPCTTSFAEIPAVSFPLAAVLTDAQPQIEALMDGLAETACDGKLYDLRVIPDGGRAFVPGLTSH